MSRRAQVYAVARRARRLPRAQWTAHWRRRPVEPDTVLYESGYGAGLLDSPYALFRELLADQSLRRLHHVWVVADAEVARRAAVHLRDLGASGRVTVVRRLGPAHLRHLATAGYLISSSTLPPEVAVREGQTYLMTWHGTPLKSMGADTPGGVLASPNVSRNFLSATYLLSSGPYMTDTMYRGAYRLEGFAPGRVLEVGMPRTDVQVQARAKGGTSLRVAARERLRSAGVDLGSDRPVLLVALTWRGSDFGDPQLDAESLLDLVARLRDVLGTRWQVIVKAHPAVHARVRDLPGLRGALVGADIPTNEVLALVDHLVTDYSSILFDALATPDISLTFHLPDRVEYERLRPTYLPVEDLPGPTGTTAQETAEGVLEQVGADPGGRAAAWSVLRQEWAERYAPLDDGGAARRVVDAVWRGEAPTTGREVSLAERRDGRRLPRVLVHAGSLQRNGVTSSLLALLGHLDLDQVDVTVTWGPARGADPEGFVAGLDPRIRVLPRIGGLVGPKRVVWSRRLLEHLGAQHPLVPMRALVGLLQEEWVRCFGQAQVDHVLDFGGYSPYWALLMSRGVAPGSVRTHAIWLHNDLAAEVESTRRHRAPRARQLTQVFGLYRRYDRLVSVSPALTEVNEASLSCLAGDAEFVSASNVIDAERVRGLAEVPVTDLGLPDGALAALRDPDVVTVATAGRLTPVKNHARLIRAAARARDEGAPFVALVMGSGPLDASLRTLVEELDLQGLVHLTGHLTNPFPVIAAADCFALTSEHEGLPMVILEALALGTPVVTTDFSSVEGVIPPGCGVVVERDDAAVARAIMTLVRERPSFDTLDVAAYNARALVQFAAAIDLDIDVSIDTDNDPPPPSRMHPSARPTSPPPAGAP